MSDLLLEDNKCFHFLINGLTVISLTQVYQELHDEGYLVDYERVPLTDEKAPEEQDIDDLVSKMF